MIKIIRYNFQKINTSIIKNGNFVEMKNLYFSVKKNVYVSISSNEQIYVKYNLVGFIVNH